MRYLSLVVPIVCSIWILLSCSDMSDQTQDSHLMFSSSCSPTCLESTTESSIKNLALQIELKSYLKQLTDIITETFTEENVYSAFDYDSFYMVRNGSFFTLRFIEDLSRRKELYSMETEAQNLLNFLNYKASGLSKKNIPQDNLVRFIKCFDISKFNSVLNHTKRTSDKQIYFDLFEALDTKNTLFISHIKDFPELLALNSESVSKGLRVGALSISQNKGLPFSISPVRCSDYISRVLSYNIKLSKEEYQKINTIIQDLTKLLDSQYKE